MTEFLQYEEAEFQIHIYNIVGACRNGSHIFDSRTYNGRFANAQEYARACEECQ